MTGESIGKFITDNHDFLGQLILFATLVLKMGRDYIVGRQKDRERKYKEDEAQVERQQIINTVNKNTALTAHVANAVAQSQGKTLEEIIVEADRDLDSILARYTIPYEGNNEPGRIGQREP